MIKTRQVLFIFCVLGYLLLSATSVYAAQEWRIVLLPQTKVAQRVEHLNNAGIVRQSTTRTNQNNALNQTPSYLYQHQIEHAIVAQLLAANFEVVDKALLSSDSFSSTINSNSASKSHSPQSTENIANTNLSNTNLSHTNLPNISFPHTIELTELTQQQANLAIRYTLEINRQAGVASPQWHYQLSVTLVDLISKNKIETHQVSHVFSGMPQPCNKNCQEQLMAKWAGQLARDAGAVLVEKLQHLPRRYHFLLTFNHFNDVALTKIHTFISEQKQVVFSELVENLLPNDPSLAQLSGRRYRYVSLLPADALDVLFTQFFYNNDMSVTKSNTAGDHFYFIGNTSKLRLSTSIFLAFCCALLIWLVYLVNTKNKNNNRTLGNKTDNIAYEKAAEHLIKKVTQLTEPVKNQSQNPINKALSEQMSPKASKKLYQALSLIDAFSINYSSQNNAALNNDEISEELNAMRENVISLLTPITHNIQCNNVFIFQQTAVYVGCLPHKPTSTTLANEHINKRLALIDIQYVSLLSPKEQGLISFDHGCFYFKDLNNKTLTQINYQALPTNTHQVINDNDRIMLAVESENNIPLCQLTCQLQSGNLMLKLDQSLPHMFDVIQVSALWPTWQQDIKKSWILQQQKLAIMLDEKGVLTFTVSTLNTSAPLAWLSYHQGYAIAPVIKGETPNLSTPLFINGAPIYTQVPISIHAHIVLADQLLTIV